MTMLAHIPRVEHVTYACAIEQRDIIVAMSAHPGHYVIPVEVAQTIASWYHSPADGCRNITALSHGGPDGGDPPGDPAHRRQGRCRPAALGGR
jgi:hypothetical protein